MHDETAVLDIRGYDIEPGDVIVYATMRGDSAHLREARVESIKVRTARSGLEYSIKAQPIQPRYRFSKDTRAVTLTHPDRIAIIEKGRRERGR